MLPRTLAPLGLVLVALGTGRFVPGLGRLSVDRHLSNERHPSRDR